MQLELIRETADYLVVNKPSGLLTMPARGSLVGKPDLEGLLRKQFGEIFVVHRLDMDASGLIIFAKNAAAHRYFSGLFETRDVEKKYLVVVEGYMQKERDEINKPLTQRGSGRMSVAFDGKASLTKYSLSEKLKGASLLEVSIVTGRRHQIRAHLYSIGHPVLGDNTYGEAAAQRKFPRLMLHSWRLRFKDLSGKTVSCEADPPADFMSVLKVLGH